MRIRARTRSERKKQIVAYLEIGSERDKNFCPSAVQVAKGLDLSPSHHLRDMLNEMVQEGAIMAFDIPHRGVCKFRRYYMLIPANRGRPKRKREIVLNVNGKPAGVMTLPGFEENE